MNSWKKWSRKTKALEAYQESEERPEDLECIPMLKRSDIRKEVNGFSNEELQVENSLFLYQDVCTNGIGYVNVMFEIKDMAVEKVHYLGLLKSVLGYVDTKNYTYGQLFNETNARTGGIQCGVDVFDKARRPGSIPYHVYHPWQRHCIPRWISCSR